MYTAVSTMEVNSSTSASGLRFLTVNFAACKQSGAGAYPGHDIRLAACTV